MTYDEDSSVLESIFNHLMSFFKNDIFIKLNEHYDFRWLGWAMNVGLCSWCKLSIWTTNVKWFLIDYDLSKFYAQKIFFS